jgi:hypothetical protein
MALSEVLCDLYALDFPLLVRRRAQKGRNEWVSEILSKRQTFGEFSHIWSDLQEDESQYFGYFRMKQDTFEYIFSNVQHQFKKYSNLRETISPEELLAVTLS